MKILFLTRFDFLKDKKDGGVLVASRNYEMLCDLYGDKNVILYILSPEEKEAIDKVKYFKIDDNLIVTYLHYMALKDKISGKIKRVILKSIIEENPDIVFFDGSTFGQIIRMIKSKGIKSIVFFHNIERQYTWEQVKKYSILCIFRYLATAFNERKMAKYGNKVICLNKRDAELLKKYYGREVDLIWPVTFKDTYEMTKNIKIVENVDLLYIGSYYAHNYTGLIWFIENVMPYITRQLTIVGKDMDRLSSKIKVTKNICIVGTVENIQQYYMSANAIVMPVFMGGGMKVKTAEAMMYGKTIFASKEALEGYETEGVEHIFLCNSADDFIKKINQYDFRKENLLNNDVRQLFLGKYCTSNYILDVRKFVDML